MSKLCSNDRLPLISIIVPAYNVEPYLKQCIDSICKQTYENIEILLVVTASDDKTEKISQRLAKQDHRIVLLTCEKKGVSNARNIALSAAKGTYMAFVDADDWIEEEYIERLYSNIDGNEMSICGFDRIGKDDTKKELLGEDKRYVHSGLIADVLCDNRIGGYLWNKLFCSEFIHNNDITFSQELSIGEDMYFIACYAKHVKNAYYNNKILYHYRTNTNSALQKMYQTGVFEMNKLSNMLAASYIEKLYSESQEEDIRKAVSYRVVRTSMWTMLNLLKCDYYDKEILKDIQSRIKIHLNAYLKSRQSKKLEKICAVLICKCPHGFWYAARIMLRIFSKNIFKFYVNT